MSRWRRRLGRVVVALVALGMFSIGGASRASAHAVLADSIPLDGETLDATPERVVLHFSEPIVRRLTELHIDGATTEGVVSDIVVGDEGSQVSARLQTLPQGVYSLVWSTRSADDMHRASGSIVFGVGRIVSASGRASARPRALDVALRSVDLVATAVLGGALVVATGVLPAFARRRKRQGVPADSDVAGMERTCIEMAGWAATCAIVADLALIAADVGVTDGRLVARLSSVLESSSYGRWSMLRCGVLAALVAGALRRRPRRERPPSRRGPALLLGIAATAFVVGARTSHVAAGADDLLLATATVAVHHAAASACIGGVLVLAILATRIDRDALRDLAFAFGPVGLASAVTLVTTGLVMTGRQVGTADAVMHSLYGTTLTGKLVLSLVFGAFGLRHAMRVRQRTGGVGPSPRSLLTEGVAGLAVLGVAAILTLAAPPRDAGARLGEGVTRTLTTQDRDVLLVVGLRPNVPGTSYMTVQAVDTRRPPVAMVDDVVVTLRSPDGSPVRATSTKVAADRFVTEASISRSGPWSAVLEVRRSDGKTAIARMQWSIDAPSRSLTALLDRTAIVVGLCADAVLLLFIVRRRRRSPGPGDPDAEPRAADVVGSARREPAALGSWSTR